MLFSPVNLPYWILLGTGVLLFLAVIFSGGGDNELDADADAEVDGDASSLDVLSWLGFGQAPLILLLATDLSLWGILGWMFNVWVGSSQGGIPAGFWGSGILVVSLAIALFLGGLIARPIGKALAAFGEDTSSDRLIGCVGTVSSALIPAYQDQRIGQVDVLDSARNLVTVNAILPEWATVIPRQGDKVLIIDRESQGYLVITPNSPDQDRWLANSAPTGPSN